MNWKYQHQLMWMLVPVLKDRVVGGGTLFCLHFESQFVSLSTVEKCRFSTLVCCNSNISISPLFLLFFQPSTSNVLESTSCSSVLFSYNGIVVDPTRI